jgi:hypothetical protein
MKTYKDLTLEQELEYTLWLVFFEQSIDNALFQIKRWNKSKKGWDLEMFFMAVSCIDDAVVAINKFLNLGKDFVNEPELNNAFKEFRKKIKNHNIKDIRNDLIHRERLSKQQDKKGNSLPKRSILVLGGYNFSTDEYEFNACKIKLSEIFSIIRNFKKEIKIIFEKKLQHFYQIEEVKDFKSMIPYTFLHTFEGRIKPDMHSLKAIKNYKALRAKNFRCFK